MRCLIAGMLLAFSSLVSASTLVVLETNRGDIQLELNTTDAPSSVENFLKYVASGHYDGTQFHRVIAGFMIQGGGFDSEFNRLETLDPIDNEADNGLKNDRYSIAMARTGDPHSATAQFFINVANNDFLNHTGKTTRGWGYAVFGQVVSGQDVVDAIAGSDTGANGPFGRDVPVEPVVIVSARVVDAE